MPHSYYGILALLAEAPERSMTMGQIATFSRSSPSRLSRGWRGSRTGNGCDGESIPTTPGW
jgi:hypothetical protein